MFRLTAVLLAGLYAAFVIWGGDAPVSDVPVTRAEAVPAATPGPIPRPPRDTSAGSDLTEQEAIEIALAAATQDVATAEPAVTPPAPTAAEAEAVEDTGLWYVTGTRVNLRSAPSSSAPIVGGVSIGDRAEVLSDPGASWVRIRTERGLEAWIFARFLSETPA